MDTPAEPKYTGLPRRYEETKPALDQVFTHSNILRIGEKILGKFQDNAASDKGSAIKNCEERVWAEAEEYKNRCVKEALEQAAAEEAQRVQNLEKRHAKHLENEVERIMELMRQQCVEERYEERKDGERRMQELREQLGRKYELEKMAEVKSARIEEQGIAENASQEMMRRHEEAMQIFGEEMEEAKRSELAALRFKLEDFRLESVKQAREEEQHEAADNLTCVRSSHQAQVENLNEIIKRLTNEKNQLESDLNIMTQDRDKYVEKYKKLRGEFTGFIEGCRSDFSSGQSDFLLPPN